MLKLLIKILILDVSIDTFFEKVSRTFGTASKSERHSLHLVLQELYVKLYGFHYDILQIQYIYNNEPIWVLREDIRSLSNILKNDGECI